MIAALTHTHTQTVHTHPSVYSVHFIMTLNSKMSLLQQFQRQIARNGFVYFGRNCLYRTKYLNQEREGERKE